MGVCPRPVSKRGWLEGIQGKIVETNNSKILSSNKLNFNNHNANNYNDGYHDDDHNDVNHNDEHGC